MANVPVALAAGNSTCFPVFFSARLLTKSGFFMTFAAVKNYLLRIIHIKLKGD